MNLNDLLFSAAERGNLPLVIQFYLQGADIEAVYAPYGTTPLYIAAQNGHSKVAEFLLDKGADPAFRFLVNNMTPLGIASYHGHLETVKKLIEYEADIDAVIGKTPIIHYAVQRGHKDIVKYLLEKGASIEKVAILDSKEQTILEFITNYGNSRLNSIGCYSDLNEEIFAQEGINYSVENKNLMEDSSYHMRHVNNYFQNEPKIPLITHHIYFTSEINPRKIDDLSLNKTVVSIQRLNEASQGWKHYIWTNNKDIIPINIKSLVGVEVKLSSDLEGELGFQQLLDILSNAEDSTSYVQASDVTRVIATNKYGGIYMDFDYEIYKPNNLVQLLGTSDFIGGKELNTFLSATGNAFFASKANHPILEYDIRLILRNLDKENSETPEYVKYTCSKWHETWYKTSPPTMTVSVLKQANKNGTKDIILSSEELYNYEYARAKAPNSRCHDPKAANMQLGPKTIGADMFCGSWGAKESFLNVIYYSENEDLYLYEAASNGYTRIVQYFVEEKKANVNFLYPVTGKTPLLIAVINQHYNTVKYLLEASADVNLKSSNNISALGYAVLNKDEEISQLLIAAQADVNALSFSNETLVEMANGFTPKNEPEVVNTVQIKYSDTEDKLKNYQYTKDDEAFFEAARLGLFEELKFFVEDKNIRVNALNPSFGCTALHIAVQGKFYDMAQYLLEKGASVKINQTGGMPVLGSAIQNSDFKMAKLLLNHGAKVDALFPTGASMLLGAISVGNIAIVNLLLEHGASKHFIFQGKTLYQFALEIGIKEIVKIFEMDAMKYPYNAQLFDAAMNGQAHIVDAMIKLGANLEFSVNEKTPLYAAIFNGHLDIVKLLIDSGASIEDNNHRFTPMFIAAAKGLNKNATPNDKAIYEFVRDKYWEGIVGFHKEQDPENFVTKFQVVVARYNEDISWIEKEFPLDKVTIYNKGPDIITSNLNWTVINNVPNYGLEPYSYLTHIINNYDNFDPGERIAFFQGITYDHPSHLPLSIYKEKIHSGCQNIFGKCEETSIKFEIDEMDKTIATNGWLTYDGGKYADVVMRDYTIEKFLDKFICKYPREAKFYINWGAEFAVDSEVIKLHCKEYYQAIFESLNDIPKPIEVHYLERFWDLVFGECIYGRDGSEYY